MKKAENAPIAMSSKAYCLLLTQLITVVTLKIFGEANYVYEYKNHYPPPDLPKP